MAAGKRKRRKTELRCTTAQMCGWGGIKNGELLRRAEGQFGLFITADQNNRYQQKLAGFHIAILELSTNDLPPQPGRHGADSLDD